MNYYERHIGDYLKDTAHLSLLEHGVYGRLLDVYYTREGPISDAEAARLIGARSREEKAALRAILAEFFFMAEGSLDWSHKRCDAEVARYQDKQRKAKASADARWSQSGRNANAFRSGDANGMRTHSDGNADDMPHASAHGAHPATGAHPSPGTRHQTPDKDLGRAATAESVAREPEPDGRAPTPAGSMCRAMRQAGLQQTNPGDPRLLALIEQGATEAEFVSVAAEAAAGAKGWPWVLKVVEARRAEAERIALRPLHDKPPTAAEQRMASAVSPGLLAPHLRHAAQPPQPTAEVIDVTARRLG